MKSILKSAVMLIVFAILIFAIGCNAENPICTDNFCAIGEVFPRSELDTADFSEVDIDDSVIFATLVGVPQPVETAPIEPDMQTMPADSVVFADVVRNVANDGTKYASKTITFTATVEADASKFKNQDFILLDTNNEKVTFYILSDKNPARVWSYKEGMSYTFTVFIRQIARPEAAFPSYGIFSDILENDAVLSVSLADLVSDALSGNRRYVNKVVRFTATVDNDKSVFTPNDTITLVTGNKNVNFFVGNRTKHLSVMDKYRSGKPYTFTIYIFDIKPGATKGQNIWGRIVLE